MRLLCNLILLSLISTHAFAGAKDFEAKFSDTVERYRGKEFDPSQANVDLMRDLSSLVDLAGSEYDLSPIVPILKRSLSDSDPSVRRVTVIFLGIASNVVANSSQLIDLEPELLTAAYRGKSEGKPSEVDSDSAVLTLAGIAKSSSVSSKRLSKESIGLFKTILQRPGPPTMMTIAAAQGMTWLKNSDGETVDAITSIYLASGTDSIHTPAAREIAVRYCAELAAVDHPRIQAVLLKAVEDSDLSVRALALDGFEKKPRLSGQEIATLQHLRGTEVDGQTRIKLDKILSSATR